MRNTHIRQEERGEVGTLNTDAAEKVWDKRDKSESRRAQVETSQRFFFFLAIQTRNKQRNDIMHIHWSASMRIVLRANDLRVHLKERLLLCSPTAPRIAGKGCLAAFYPNCQGSQRGRRQVPFWRCAKWIFSKVKTEFAPLSDQIRFILILLPTMHTKINVAKAWF